MIEKDSDEFTYGHFYLGMKKYKLILFCGQKSYGPVSRQSHESRHLPRESREVSDGRVGRAPHEGGACHLPVITCVHATEHCHRDGNLKLTMWTAQASDAKTGY